MKLRKQIILLTAAFLAVIMIFSLISFFIVRNTNSLRYVCINRLEEEISEEIRKQNITSDETEAFNRIIQNICSADSSSTDMKYPDSVVFIPASFTRTVRTDIKEYDIFIIPVSDSSDRTAGFAEFIYRRHDIFRIIVTADIFLAVCYILSLSVYAFAEKKVLKPFNSMIDYPEKLSLGLTETKLPENKNRYFGKYIWGMNMLRDSLNDNRLTISRLEHERQTLLTSIAHGIKTPVTNILLYAEAIETGLYSAGKTTPEDAAIAAKISKNAEDIRKLTSELLENTSSAAFDYTPVLSEFYFSEIAEMLKSEYHEKFTLLRIPYSIICESDAILNSDKTALVRICVQIIENAVKYGNGKGISIILDRADDCFSISIRNKGNLLSEDEIPFIFNSFWRGSNASGIEGNGIGMYVSRKTARTLGGDLYAEVHRDTGETEFILIIPE